MEKTEAPSIADLRSMLAGKTPEAAKPAAEETTAAPAKTDARTDPASEPDDKGDAKAERGADGKFKAKAPDAEAPISPNAQKRIDRLTKEKAELQAQLDGKSGPQPAKQTAPPDEKKAAVQAEVKAKPEEKNFDSYNGYIEALTDWKVDAKRAEDAKAAEAKASEERAAEVAKTHAARIEATREKHEDYDEVIESAKDIDISPALLEAIRDSEHGPQIVYDLAKNREEAKRIAALSPVRQVAEFGKLEAKLEAESAPKDDKPKPKPLPKPAKPVGGGTSAKQSSLSDRDLSMREFKALAAAQLRR